MAEIIRTFLYPDGNVKGNVSYDVVDGTTFALAAIDPDQPVNDGVFAGPNDGVPDGSILVAEYCVLNNSQQQTGESLKVVAISTHPYAEVILTPDAPMCAVADTCDIRATVSYNVAANLVVLNVTTSAASWSSTDSPGGQLQLGRTDYPASPGQTGMLYLRDSNNCPAAVPYAMPGSGGGNGGGGVPAGEVIETFEPGSESVKIYYDDVTGLLGWQQTPGDESLPSPLSPAQRGREVDELIPVPLRCDGTTQVQFYATMDAPYARIERTANSTACGYVVPVADITLVTKEEQAATVADPAHGLLKLQVAGGAGQRYVSVPGVVTDAAMLVSGYIQLLCPPGTHTATVRDSSTPAKTLVIPFTIAPAAQEETGGCTDPNALNYAASAAFENGSCLYAPPDSAPYFQVPLLNGLHFVVEQDANSCTVFENPENTLFCQQTRWPQQVRPRYYQKVQQCDTLRLQVLTNLSSVTANIRRLASQETELTVDFTRALKLTGAATPLDVVLSESDGFTRISAADDAALPENLLRALRVTLSGGATGNYRVKSTALDTTTGLKYLLISRPWAEALAVKVSWELIGPAFDVWEGALSFASLDEAEYDVQLVATSDDDQGSFVAVSEPLSVAETWERTVLVEYRNSDNAYGVVWTTGITPRLRVDGSFFKRKTGGSLALHRNSDDSPVVLSSSAQRRIILETRRLPDYLHEKLDLVCRLDWLRVNGSRFLAGEEAYEAAEQLNYPLTDGSIALEQLAWLGAGNGHDTGLVDGPAPVDNLIVNGDYLKVSI